MGFTPSERPRLAVAVDGTLAAIHEPARITIVELPGIAPFTEIGIDPQALATEIAWVSMPPRLLVVSRFAAHSTALLLDPYGPRTIAEIRLETPMKLFGATGSHALAAGARGAAVLTASDTHLTPYQFPARTVPVAAGAAGNHFVVALASTIEEWDPAARMPKRRLKLRHQTGIAALGGTDRVVWSMTQNDLQRIDVIPLVNRGQPKTHDLPEPVAEITANPRIDLLACIGADSGRLYIVDLDGRAGMRVVGPPGIARVESAALVVGRTMGVLAAQANHAVAFVSLDGLEQPEAARPVLAAPKDAEPPPAKSTLFDDEASAASERLSAYRASAAAAAKPAPVATPGQGGLSLRDRLSGPTWRDKAASWYREVSAGSASREAPVSIAISKLLVRLEVPPELEPALILLYGAHLAGTSAAPVDVARVLGTNWTEALGRGHLAERGVAIYADSRVRLSRTIQRTLDELPPETGTLVGEPGTVSLIGPCAIVLSDPLAELANHAERFVGPIGSAILAAHTHADPRDVLVEARAQGAVPMIRIFGAQDDLPDQPVILVAVSEPEADALGIPRID